MERYVALLRGINLGRRRVQMTRLRALFEELGFGAVETFIASGNVIFSGKAEGPGRLETRIAAHLESSLGYGVDTFVRTLDEIAAIARGRVFTDDGREGVTIHVGFLQRELEPGVGARFAAIRTKEDEIRIAGREYYWLCRVRTPDSKVWALPEMRALRLPTSTMRNITSLRKLVAKHAAQGDRVA
jgi:uncharacterized protein (DUF1697 family)